VLVSDVIGVHRSAIGNAKEGGDKGKEPALIAVTKNGK